MKEENLDSLLDEIGKKPLPALPGNFRQNVRREIHRRQELESADWKSRLEELLGSFLQPNPIMASLALTLIVSVAITLPLHQPFGSAKASKALALNVFAPGSEGSGMWTGGPSK